MEWKETEDGGEGGDEESDEDDGEDSGDECGDGDEGSVVMKIVMME